MTIVFPFGISTAIPPLTLRGIMLYSQRETRNDPTSHAQTAMPIETETNKVGINSSRAAPSQKREKRRAVTKEKRIVARTKDAKRAIGVKEMRSWMKRKAARRGWSFAKLLTLL